MSQIQIGQMNTLSVIRSTEQGVYLKGGEDGILLPKRYVPEGVSVDDELDVFIYNDSEDRLIATTEEPFVELGQYACLEVMDVVPFGVFLNWGLSKDLLLPKSEQLAPLYKSDFCVVQVCIDDKTSRLYGSCKITRTLETDCSSFEYGSSVEGLIYEFSDLGASIIVDGGYRALIHKSDMVEDFKIGEQRSFYVKSFTEDNRMNVSLRKPGYKGIFDSVTIIENALKENDGYLPLHDKSTPDEIRKILKISKKGFKEAIGRLYRERVISIEKEGIRLV